MPMRFRNPGKSHVELTVCLNFNSRVLAALYVGTDVGLRNRRRCLAVVAG